ncbi:MAG: nucleoid-associated protein [Symbiopectobacterium sp.]
MRGCCKGEEDFLGFIRAATARLRNELAKYPFAEGASCCFANTAIWRLSILLVAVLSSCSSMRVNEQLYIPMRI